MPSIVNPMLRLFVRMNDGLSRQKRGVVSLASTIALRLRGQGGSVAGVIIYDLKKSGMVLPRGS